MAPSARRSRPRRVLQLVLVVLWTGVVLTSAGAIFEVVEERADSRRCPPPGRFYRVGNHRLHIVCEGEGEPPVILEHTGVGGLIQYDDVRRLLKPFTQVCAYDRAGMGWSDPSVRPLSAGVLAEDLRGLLQAAEIAPPHVLVAGSVGGLTALMLARQHRDEVAGLVLLDVVDETTIDRLPQIPRRLRRLAGMTRVASHIGLLRLADPFGLRQLPSEKIACARRIVYRNAHWNAVHSIVGNMERSAKELSRAPPLSRDLPLVVIRHGVVGDLLGPGASRAQMDALEPVWQELQRELADRSDRGRYVVASKSGHLIAVDDPELVVEEVRRLLDLVRGGQARE